MADSSKREQVAPLSEHGLIAKYFAPLAAGLPGAADLKDDAATLTPPPGCDLVITTDALVGDVHFFKSDAPADIAYKALAVNVSDLAAKAADPLAYSLALALPGDLPDGWIAGFAAGLHKAQQAFDMTLSGGDTTRSADQSLVISITAFGLVPTGKMIRRGVARSGDRLYVSGTIGDAALGLQLHSGHIAPSLWGLSQSDAAVLIDRYLHPQPRQALREALRGAGGAAMDISDGLAIDCQRMCAASGGSGRIDAGRVPLSDAAAKALARDGNLLETILTGGDDYEILAAIPPSHCTAFEAAASEAGIAVSCIGECDEGEKPLTIIGEEGAYLHFDRLGYDHLAG